MKMNTILLAGFLVVLTMVRPASCRAQAEIDPDHYEMSNDESTAATPSTTKLSAATTNRSADGFLGKFILPFDIRYAGVILPRGSYSVSVGSLRKANVVTLIPDGKAVRLQAIQARLRTRSDVEGPNALVIERKGRKRTLSAIRLNEPRITLDLSGEERGTDSVDAELVPISSMAR
jgi:hypothetical protein